MATKAFEEFQYQLANITGGIGDLTPPHGTGYRLTQMIQEFETSRSNPSAKTDDFASVNLGQLKQVAKPFNDRLFQLRFADHYPWARGQSAADDYAIANLGQVKSIFSFDLSRYRSNADPSDTDADGIPNHLEIAWGLDPHNPADAVARLDGKGRTALEYYREGDIPSDGDVIAPERWDARPRLTLYQTNYPDGSYDLYWEGDVEGLPPIQLKREAQDGTWQVFATVPAAAKFYHVEPGF